jgi:mannosyltransferase
MLIPIHPVPVARGDWSRYTIDMRERLDPHEPLLSRRPPTVRELARRPILYLGVVLVAGLLFRADHLDGRSYWFDEGFSWKLLTFPWPEMIARVARDNHGPLYFVLAKLWAGAFGDSARSLRSLSVLLGELTILGMYLLAREAYRTDGGDATAGGSAAGRAEQVGLLAAALVAVSTFQIHWATEVRMYTLGTALAALSGWLLLRALFRPGFGFGRWVGYALAVVLFAYTHPYTLFSIAAQAAFGFGYVAVRDGGRPAAVCRDARARGLLLSYLAALVLWLPWLPVLLRQRRQVEASFWLPPMSWWLVGKTAFQMFAPSQYTVPPVWVAALAVAACAAAFAALLWRAGPADWFVFLSAAGPVALSAALSFAQFNIFHRHYFIFAHLFFLATIAVLVARVRPSPVRRAAAAAVLLAFLGVYAVYARERAARAVVPGARAAAAFLDSRRAPGELVVVCSLMLTPCLEGHARHAEGWHTYLPPEGYRHYEGTAVARTGELVSEGDLRRLSGVRVWVVDVERWEKKAPTVPVLSTWAKIGEWRFSEVYGDGCEIIVRAYATPPQSERAGVD